LDEPQHVVGTTPAVADADAKEPSVKIIDGLRLAVVALVFGLGLEAALGAPTNSCWVRLAAGLGTFAVSSFLLWLPWSRDALMWFAARVLRI
jgi:hypothetical protein